MYASNRSSNTIFERFTTILLFSTDYLTFKKYVWLCYDHSDEYQGGGGRTYQTCLMFQEHLSDHENVIFEVCNAPAARRKHYFDFKE